jgi:hypothetical protein
MDHILMTRVDCRLDSHHPALKRITKVEKIIQKEEGTRSEETKFGDINFCLLQSTVALKNGVSNNNANPAALFIEKFQRQCYA